MADKTGISWTNATWNPTTGCDRVSPGCDHCYALTMAARLKAMGSAKYQNDGDPRTSGPGFGVAVHPDALDVPLRWREPRRVFVNSMSDLWHQDVPEGFIGSVWNTMALAQRHTFQVLTKRHARMRSVLKRWQDAGWYWRRDDMMWCGPLSGPLPNVWCGVSVENQRWADIRVPALLDTPVAVRWLSCEPLLGPVDLTCCGGVNAIYKDWAGGPGGGTGAPHPFADWVVIGGESGPGYREMNIDWLVNLAGQCQDEGIPVWIKQDSGPRSGMQGRIPDDIWKLKQFPGDVTEGRL